MICSTVAPHRNPSRTRTRLAAALAGVAFTASPLAALGPLDTLLAQTPCRRAIVSLLERWESVPAAALLDPIGPTGARSARVPTTSLGVWLRLTVDDRGSAQLERFGAGVGDDVRLGPACEPRPVPRAPLPMSSADGFDDRALTQLLAEGGRGVILWWSPHMPLSIDQYDVLRGVDPSYGLRLVPVLDPLADRAQAGRVVAAGRMPREALRPAASVELAFRGMSTHAPSLLAFADGRLDRAVMFGYRDTAALQPVLQRLFVQPGRKDAPDASKGTP